jgi:hypothetical protein
MTPKVVRRYKAEGHGPCNVDTYHVYACLVWLNHYATIRKTKNERRSSYGLKHMVERRIPTRMGYVSNGAMIVAAYKFGAKTYPIDGDLNALFNLNYAKEGL